MNEKGAFGPSGFRRGESAQDRQGSAALSRLREVPRTGDSAAVGLPERRTRHLALGVARLRPPTSEKTRTCTRGSRGSVARSHSLGTETVVALAYDVNAFLGPRPTRSGRGALGVYDRSTAFSGETSVLCRLRPCPIRLSRTSHASPAPRGASEPGIPGPLPRRLPRHVRGRRTRQEGRAADRAAVVVAAKRASDAEGAAPFPPDLNLGSQPSRASHGGFSRSFGRRWL